MLNAAWIVAVAMTLQTAPAPPPPAPTPAEWTDDRPLTRLPQNLGHDLTKLPSRQNGITLGAGLLGVALAHPVDDDVSARWYGSPPWSYSGLGTLFGSAWFQTSGAVATYSVGRLSHRPAVTHIGSDLIRAQLLNAVLTSGLKVAVGRTRPDGGSYSFPSGHTSSIVASVAVLSGHFGWRIALPGYALAGFAGWTRVRDNRHWLSDVVFGGAVGLIAGQTVNSTHKHAGWMVAPVVSKNGAAIYVMRR